MEATKISARILAVPTDVRAMLPCDDLAVRDLLAVEPGTIIRTLRPAGDNVDVHISDQAIGQAELIVINNSLAVRISELTENT